MIRPTAVLIAIIAVAVPLFCQPQSLDLASRSRYQRAVEEVYWRHRIWPEQNPSAKPALDAVISPEQLDARAEDALRLSNALQHYWRLTITGQQLQAELIRLAQNTRQPEVLRELFAALNNDPHLIVEVLARPLLAERLARSAYQSDRRFSAAQQPFEVWWRKVRTNFPADAAQPDFTYYVPALRNAPAAESWSPTQMLPEGTLSMSAVWTGSEMIVWGGFNSIGGKFNTGSRYNPATDMWHATNNSSAPNGKMQHTAIWTGTEMIIWGGCNANFSEHQCESRDGGRYNPISDSWIPTTLANAPDARLLHQAVWTGKEMIVWGGCAFINDGCSAQHLGNSGGRYNPSTNTWVQINLANAPEARTNHTAVWNGRQMMIWGGYNDHAALSSGASYNPSADSWTAISSVPASAARFQHTAVWTGKEMLIWGGTNFTTYFRNGGAYNPVTKHWRALSGTGAPSARAVHTAVWTGSEMIVWGGINGTTLLNTGGRYNPATNTWKTTTTTNAPSQRQGAVAVWTGSTMIIWGGQQKTGGRYDPISDSWTPTSANDAPSPREWHTGVWTGTEMVVWGGDSAEGGTSNSGGRYNLATDTWAPTSAVGVPGPRHIHTVVWTGTEMIIWGGAYGSTVFNDGGRYNPVADTWKPTGTTQAPEARAEHSVVWSGTEMIIWGGSGENSGWLRSGGRYNPSTDSWKAVPTQGAPIGRSLAAAVWSGTEMIIWGGATSNFDTNTGGRYNPTTNTWTQTTTTNAPSARNWTAAVWTGSKMLIWGGQTYDGITTIHNDGALYDPASNSWTPTTLTNAPAARTFFGYVWTGNELIAWSGCVTQISGCKSTPTGGRYNPVTDSWAPTTLNSAPGGRAVFPAVWTGSQMIVWSGMQTTYTATGGVYTPGP